MQELPADPVHPGLGPGVDRVSGRIVSSAHGGGRRARRGSRREARRLRVLAAPSSPGRGNHQQHAHAACKPDSVAPEGRRSFIWEGRCRPPRAAYPEVVAGRATPTSLFGLAPSGVCRAGCVATPAVGSYPAVSPSPARPMPRVGSLFSVALSLGLPPVGVTHHCALRSPDFPRPAPRPAAAATAACAWPPLYTRTQGVAHQKDGFVARARVGAVHMKERGREGTKGLGCKPSAR